MSNFQFPISNKFQMTNVKILDFDFGILIGIGIFSYDIKSKVL
jgi:hypothetical protein